MFAWTAQDFLNVFHDGLEEQMVSQWELYDYYFKRTTINGFAIIHSRSMAAVFYPGMPNVVHEETSFTFWVPRKNI